MNGCGFSPEFPRTGAGAWCVTSTDSGPQGATSTDATSGRDLDDDLSGGVARLDRGDRLAGPFERVGDAHVGIDGPPPHQLEDLAQRLRGRAPHRTAELDDRAVGGRDHALRVARQWRRGTE